MPVNKPKPRHDTSRRNPSLHDAEAALRLLRRRYWTVRRVSFAIAYQGVLVFFLVGPWVVVGLVLWRSGMLQQSTVLPWLPRAVETPAVATLPVRIAPGDQVMTFTDAQATAWVRTAAAAYPQLQQPTVRFVPGAAVVSVTLVGQASLPIVVRVLPRLGEQGIAVSLEDIRVGVLPSAAADAVARPLLEPILSQYAAQWNAAYVISGVQIDAEMLRVSGYPRKQ
ncbi:MAG: hypothetical protein Q7S23_01040 [bacterium]|nr:hypothetical protein [bacterium]